MGSSHQLSSMKPPVSRLVVDIQAKQVVSAEEKPTISYVESSDPDSKHRTIVKTTSVGSEVKSVEIGYRDFQKGDFVKDNILVTGDYQKFTKEMAEALKGPHSLGRADELNGGWSNNVVVVGPRREKVISDIFAHGSPATMLQRPKFKHVFPKQ